MRDPPGGGIWRAEAPLLTRHVANLFLLDSGGPRWKEVVPAYARSRAELDGAALHETLIDALYPAVMR